MYNESYKITLCPPRCFTTHVKWAERPAATVMLFNGDINPGSTPVTAGGTNDESKKNNRYLLIWKVENFLRFGYITLLSIKHITWQWQQE